MLSDTVLYDTVRYNVRGNGTLSYAEWEEGMVEAIGARTAPRMIASYIVHFTAARVTAADDSQRFKPSQKHSCSEAICPPLFSGRELQDGPSSRRS